MKYLNYIRNSHIYNRIPTLSSFKKEPHRNHFAGALYGLISYAIMINKFKSLRLQSYCHGQIPAIASFGYFCRGSTYIYVYRLRFRLIVGGFRGRWQGYLQMQVTDDTGKQ